MRPQTIRSTELPSGSVDSELRIALANHLSDSRSTDAVRHAINVWCHDAVHSGVPPERVLIAFKAILYGLPLRQQSRNTAARLAERQELVSMCIEECFSTPYAASPGQQESVR